MSASQHDNEVIFHAAREIPDPDRRREYVRAACGDDQNRIAHIEALLRAADAPDSMLDRPAAELVGSATAAEAHCGGDSESSLDFLAPSEKPESLGRLGHYEIQEVVGRGGMGVVLRAFDEKLHRVVAIKVMAAQLATNATARKRFAREAQAQAAVSQDHIVIIHAVEETNGLPYLVMHFISGMSLQERLDKSGPLELNEILRIGMQTASGLAAAHAQGLVHRDIKPANILLENGVERVKITDFGLARAAADASLTQSGVVAGTPHYMSPEQAEGKAIDQRTDLFSLGSVLYAMCTGRAPFRASGSMAVLKRVCEQVPTPIRETNPGIPDWLVAIIDKLHAKDPAQRYQTAAEVAELLGRHLAHVQHPSAGDFRLQISDCRLKDPHSQSAICNPKSAIRRHRLAIAAAVLLCFVIGLSLTEATGVTNVRGTVIRILTPDGTLVVETNDPGIKVTIEGDGGLVITGAGLEEIRLRPGSYKVHADRDGKKVFLDRELVSISKGGREVVKVKLVAAPVRSVRESDKGEFVVLGGRGVAERKFATLADAVFHTSNGDTIEIRGDGPFVSDGVKIKNRTAIRAGAGYRPSITLSQVAADRNIPLLQVSAPLVLEGIELRRVNGLGGMVEGKLPRLVHAWDSGALHLANCRLVFKLDVPNRSGCTLLGAKAQTLTVRNCEMMGAVDSGCSWHFATGGRCNIENCVIGVGGIRLDQKEPHAQDVSSHIRGNTFVGDGLGLTLGSRPTLLGKLAPVPPIRLDFSRNVACCQEITHKWGVFFFHQFKVRDPFSVADVESNLPQLVGLAEKRNVYQRGTTMLRLGLEWKTLAATRGQDLADWNRFWGLKDTGSVAGDVRFQGGELGARAFAAPEKLYAADFHLRPNSVGYRAGKDGKDVGADVDLVGPGPAYERWKKTPDYQQWLKETGQVKK